MPEETDRRIQGSRPLIVLAMLLVLIIAAGGTFVWLRQRSTEAQPAAALSDSRVAVQFRLDEQLTVTLYYPAEGMLRAGAAAVRRQPDLQSQAREALSALFTDPRSQSAPVLRDIKLRSFYLDAAGTAYLDLSPGPHQEVRASAWEEHLAIYAMVNTVLNNFEELKQVVVLLEGREVRTLAGHMDLSRAFTKRMDLVKQ